MLLCRDIILLSDWLTLQCVCAQNVEPLLRTALPEVHHAAVPEVAVYLRESCGNATRIDYGTGSN